MHLGHAARQVEREAAPQSAQGLVSQPRRGHDRWRLRGDLRAEAAAAGISDAARDRHVAGLPVPRAGARHAHASDRHRPVQIRRVQAERIHPVRQEPGLLEAGPALSRRHRVDDHPEPLDPDARLYRRQVRHDLSLRGHGAVDARHQEPGARRDLRADADAGRDQPARQPRGAAVRRPGYPPGDAADDRPQELSRHHRRRPGRHQRRDAAAAGRAVGPAARDSADPARLRPRCRRPTAPRRAS